MSDRFDISGDFNRHFTWNSDKTPEKHGFWVIFLQYPLRYFSKIVKKRAVFFCGCILEKNPCGPLFFNLYHTTPALIHGLPPSPFFVVLADFQIFQNQVKSWTVGKVVQVWSFLNRYIFFVNKNSFRIEFLKFWPVLSQKNNFSSILCFFSVFYTVHRVQQCMGEFSKKRQKI